MGYLNNAGLQRFWNGIKSKFVRTVNGVAPDANGNVQVSGGSGSAIGNRGIFYGTCDTAAATVEKAVVCPDFAANDLVAGSVVMVLFSITNSGAVESLTLNVNSTGAKSIKYISNGSYANIPGAGYLKANQIYQFTFDGTYWVVEMNYDTNNNAYRMYMADARLATFTNLYRYMICFTKDATTILPVNAVSNNVNTGKQLTTESFDPFGPIWYYNTTTTVNAGAKAGSLYYFCNTVDLRYSFNTAKTLTASKNVYIVCIPYGDKVKLDPTNPISQDLPSTDDGKLYILLGVAYDTYRVSIHPNHPIYYYKKDSIREWTNSGDVMKFGSPGDVAEENSVLSYDGSWKPIGSIVIEISPTWSGNSASGNFTSEKDFTYINEAINAGNNVTILANKGTDRIIFHSVHYEPETGQVGYTKDICFRSIPDKDGYYELTRSGNDSYTYSIGYVVLESQNERKSYYGTSNTTRTINHVQYPVVICPDISRSSLALGTKLYVKFATDLAGQGGISTRGVVLNDEETALYLLSFINGKLTPYDYELLGSLKKDKVYELTYVGTCANDGPDSSYVPTLTGFVVESDANKTDISKTLFNTSNLVTDSSEVGLSTLLLSSNGKMVPVHRGSNTGEIVDNSNVNTNVSFDLFGPIYGYNGGYISFDSVPGTIPKENIYLNGYPSTCMYKFGGQFASNSIAKRLGQLVYMTCIPNSDGITAKLAGSYAFRVGLPSNSYASVHPEYVYVVIGRSTDAYGNNFELFFNHPVYKYEDEKWIHWTGTIETGTIEKKPSVFIKKMDQGKIRLCLRNVMYASLGDTKIIVKRCVGRKRGLYSWKHFLDFSELYDGFAMTQVDGYSQIKGIHYSCENFNPVYPNPPSWMPTELYGEDEKAVYSLKTVFELSSQNVSYDDDLDTYYYELDLTSWLLPMLKPKYTGNFDWTKCTLLGCDKGKAPLLFMFEIKSRIGGSWMDEIAGSSENILAVGVKRTSSDGSYATLHVSPSSGEISHTEMYISIR